MFDAKKLLDAVMAASQAPGAAQPDAAGAAPGQDLSSILGNVLGQISQTSAGAAPGAGATAGAGGLGGLLGGLLNQAGTAPSVGAAPGAGAAAGGGLGGLLGGLLSQGGGTAGAGAGGLGGLLGAVLSQATQGVQGAARDANAATGVGTGLDSILASMTGGQGSQDLINKVKDLAGQNQLVTGAAMGSLASIFLGTKAGRGLALDAGKLGGLALIGGLAYQAWQNYQAGKPPLALNPATLAQPPAESPFGEVAEEQDHAKATLLLRTMIAAASADGLVDDAEKAHILGSLQAVGLAPAAANFLCEQFGKPATPDELADEVPGPEVAAEVYAAARLTIDPDKDVEKQFLASLADKLGLDEQLVAHIDAAAAGVKV